VKFSLAYPYIGMPGIEIMQFRSSNGEWNVKSELLHHKINTFNNVCLKFCIFCNRHKRLVPDGTYAYCHLDKTSMPGLHHQKCHQKHWRNHCELFSHWQLLLNLHFLTIPVQDILKFVSTSCKTSPKSLIFTDKRQDLQTAFFREGCDALHAPSQWPCWKQT